MKYIEVKTKGNNDCKECYFAQTCDFGGCRLAGGYHYELND